MKKLLSGLITFVFVYILVHIAVHQVLPALAGVMVASFELIK